MSLPTDQSLPVDPPLPSRSPWAYSFYHGTGMPRPRTSTETPALAVDPSNIPVNDAGSYTSPHQGQQPLSYDLFFPRPSPYAPASMPPPRKPIENPALAVTFSRRSVNDAGSNTIPYQGQQPLSYDLFFPRPSPYEPAGMPPPRTPTEAPTSGVIASGILGNYGGFNTSPRRDHLPNSPRHRISNLTLPVFRPRSDPSELQALKPIVLNLPKPDGQLHPPSSGFYSSFNTLDIFPNEVPEPNPQLDYYLLQTMASVLAPGLDLRARKRIDYLLDIRKKFYKAESFFLRNRNQLLDHRSALKKLQSERKALAQDIKNAEMDTENVRFDGSSRVPARNKQKDLAEYRHMKKSLRRSLSEFEELEKDMSTARKIHRAAHVSYGLAKHDYIKSDNEPMLEAWRYWYGHTNIEFQPLEPSPREERNHAGDALRVCLANYFIHLSKQKNSCRDCHAMVLRRLRRVTYGLSNVAARGVVIDDPEPAATRLIAGQDLLCDSCRAIAENRSGAAAVAEEESLADLYD